MQIGIVLTLLVLVLVLFPLELVSVDVLALGAVLILIAMGILTGEQAFASFGSEMMVLLASIFVIAGSLLKTGMLDTVGLFLYRHCGRNYWVLLTGIVLIVGGLSAFMNNTVVTAVFVPAVLAVARRGQIPPSKLLMPIAFASMLGGCCTLIGTSTNLAASNFLTRRGMEGFALFEFLPIGVTLLVVGSIYFALIGGRLLPVRGERELTKSYHVKEYLTEIGLRAGCPFIGKRLDEAGLQELADVTVLGIVRGRDTHLAPGEYELLEKDDILLLEAGIEGIQTLRQTPGIEVKGDKDLGDRSLESGSIKLVEVMIGPGSRFAGRSLKEIDFRRRYGMTALALARQGGDVVQKVGKIPLMVGDVLLVQGSESRLDDLRSVANILILSDVSHVLLDRRKGFYIVTFFLLALIAGALGLLSLGSAVLGAALLTILAGAVRGEEVYRLIDWRLLLMIGAMTAFGQGMASTGADRFLAGLLLGLLEGHGPHVILAGFFLLTVLLSQPLSNAAAALAVLPIAIATAESIGVNPRTFAGVVTLAASASFLTPLEPSCILVYPAGRYHFTDFLKVGWGLTIAVMIVVLVMAPRIWPL